jgi:CRISPR-associated protein Cas2
MAHHYSYIAVAYDIEDNRRRNRLFQALKDFGTPVQKSVFEFKLTEEQFTEMQTRVRGLIREDRDRVLIYRLCERCARRAIAIPDIPNKSDFVI